MKKLKSRSRKRVSGIDARLRMERSDVLIKKLSQAIIGIRVFWIIFTIILFLRGILLFLVVEPWIPVVILACAICNVLFCEFLLIKNLKKYAEWSRKLSVAYLIIASCLAFLGLSIIVGACVAISTVPGFLAMLDSRTKRVFAEEREKQSKRHTGVLNGKMCAECYCPIDKENRISFGNVFVCSNCKNKYARKIKEGVK